MLATTRYVINEKWIKFLLSYSLWFTFCCCGKKNEKVFIDMHNEVLNMKVKKIKKTNLKFFIGQVLKHNTSGFHTGKEK